MMVFDELRELSKHRYVSAYDVAMIYVALEDRDGAFEWLERAYEERSIWLAFLKKEPRLDGLRTDPRLTDLLRRTNLSSS